ncbi:hypothetical protein LMG920_21955 [Xanthomonas vesicatoria]|nr:hypothetical protein LMG920_21955 [Xanthomonas vesicatoria]
MKNDFLYARDMNLAMQQVLHDWGVRNTAQGVATGTGRLLDQYLIGWFNELNGALNDTLDNDAFIARVHGNVAQMAVLAREILQQARHRHPDLPDHGLDALTANANGEAILTATWYADAA